MSPLLDLSQVDYCHLCRLCPAPLGVCCFLWAALILLAFILLLALTAPKTRCPVCDGRVSKRTEVCPDCGYNFLTGEPPAYARHIQSGYRPQPARPEDGAAPTPAEAAPMEATTVEAAPVKATPVEAAPVETAPVETAPVETAPVEAVSEAATPVEATPVAAAPVEAVSHVEATSAAAASAQPAVRFCPYCGAKLPGRAIFCVNCGHRLD